MARLRDQAHFMPPKQLRQVLNRSWDADWLHAFQHFNVRPIAAASIGQVHRARLKDGRDVAIKVQYPGIARSIDSDVANVGALVRLSGLVPKSFDLAPYMDEARKQLHEETDYAQEGAHLKRFGALLAPSEQFAIPEFYADWSTAEILTMSFLDGQPIEMVVEKDQETRNRITGALVDLTLREVFEFGVTQSDPNFANYRYNAETGKIILLDFGAARLLDPALISGYRKLLRAGLDGDGVGLREAAQDMGIVEGDGRFDDQILAMIQTVFDALTGVESFDFADRTLSEAMNRQGHGSGRSWICCHRWFPMDILYLQRKFGGMFLLASRLRAVLRVREMLARYVD